MLYICYIYLLALEEHDRRKHKGDDREGAAAHNREHVPKVRNKACHNTRNHLPRSSSGVSICTFVLVKQVNWGLTTPAHVYFCTSKASKLRPHHARYLHSAPHPHRKLALIPAWQTKGIQFTCGTGTKVCKSTNTDATHLELRTSRPRRATCPARAN